MSPARRKDAPPAADIEIGAVAKAKRIRFEKVPETEVRFPGSDQERSGSETERENLPDEVEPGVDYHDVRIRWRAGASVRAEVDPAIVEAEERERE
jgi:hypothetical protein